MMQASAIEHFAQCLLAARGARTPLALTACGDALPGNRADAYAIQAAAWRQMQGTRRPTAWKIGISPDSIVPVRAALPAVVPNQSRLRRNAFRVIGIEAEIAVRFGRALPPRPQPYAQSEVIAAIDSAYVAIEIVDTALADPSAAGPFLRLADSMLHGSFVLGERIAAWPDIVRQWHALTAHSHIDGHAVASGEGSHPLGDPLSQLAWWANAGATDWGGIQAGDLLTTGTWNGMHFAEAPRSFEARFTTAAGETLGAARVTFS
ncbi:fumarylacetoacetate hydrolase family protein [Viridibacterium curvum]|uniref:Fumarylacetoacetase-like C-terminal domain-containing protein n=1 Tax=Viridibacterium curvum TaxID=1101404 RepID=A0ABP9QBV6_9RHOO